MLWNRTWLLFNENYGNNSNILSSIAYKRALQNWHIWNEWFNNFGMRPRVSAFSALLAVRSQFLTFWNQKLSFLTFFELHFYGRQWIKFLVGWSVDYSRFWESWFMPSRFDSWKFIKIQTKRSNRNNREFNKIIKMSKNENSRKCRKNNQ